jgi:hypothetical protein
MFTAIFACKGTFKSFISNWITFFHCWENRQILDICLELDREKSQKPSVSPHQTGKRYYLNTVLNQNFSRNKRPD